MNAQPSVLAGGVPPPSLEAVFEAEQRPLLRYAFGLVGRREVAEELVQYAFLRLHQHWEEVEQPRAWLFHCVRDRADNHLRDRRREMPAKSDATVGHRPSEVDPEWPTGREAPEEVLKKLEAGGLLHVLLQELDEWDREILRMKYVEGSTYVEIAKRTETSVGNVGLRLHHLLDHLADGLRRSGEKGAQG